MNTTDNVPKGAPEAAYEPSLVALVRAVMDYIDGECWADYPGEHGVDDEGCDACAFDTLLQALPHALRREAIRYRPLIPNDTAARS